MTGIQACALPISLFAVLSAVVLDDGNGASLFDDGADESHDPGEEEDSSVPFDLPPPPPPGSGRFSMALPEDLGGRPLPAVKKELRDANAALALDILRFTGLSPRTATGPLNRLARITRLTEAPPSHPPNRNPHPAREGKD